MIIWSKGLYLLNLIKTYRSFICLSK